MRRSSGREQFEPVVALVAVLAVSAGLVTYADTLSDVLPGDRDRQTARTALDGVHDRLRVAGVAVPDRLDRALAAVPAGWHAEVTLRTRTERWQRGPDPPADNLSARRRVSVRLSGADHEPGTLRVVLWR
jgi:hypothetical protein